MALLSVSCGSRRPPSVDLAVIEDRSGDDPRPVAASEGNEAQHDDGGRLGHDGEEHQATFAESCAPLVGGGIEDRVGQAGRVGLQEGQVLVDERTRVVR